MAGTHLKPERPGGPPGRAGAAVKTRRPRKALLLWLAAGLVLAAAVTALLLLLHPAAPEAAAPEPTPAVTASPTPAGLVTAAPESAETAGTAALAEAADIARAARRRDGFPLCRWDSTLFYTAADGRLRYNDSGVKTLTGIDVSEHQNDIDWALVAADGIDFAMIRAGRRGTTEGGLFADDYFVQNIEGALKNGIPVGVYFYSQAVSVEEAQEEADYLLKLLAGYDVTYPVVFDWEIVGGEDARTYSVSRQTLCKCAEAFCDKVEAAGYDAMIYFTQYLGYRKYILRALADYGFWYAEYKPTPGFPYDFDMWQYSCTGTVSGIQGEVDLNLLFVS